MPSDRFRLLPFVLLAACLLAANASVASTISVGGYDPFDRPPLAEYIEPPPNIPLPTYEPKNLS